MPSPDGYRKALRLMKQAETLRTSRSSALWIRRARSAASRPRSADRARPSRETSLRCPSLKVPVLSLVIGEGGSGGALAMAVANEVWMMENAIYSVLSPEGFASILWKDSKKADDGGQGHEDYRERAERDWASSSG